MSQSSRALAALPAARALFLRSRFVSSIARRSVRRRTAFALLGSTALLLPSLAMAATPAPKFIDGMDDHGVDLVSGLPYFAVEEGGIGSGKGRVAMQRIWAEGAGWVDNWSGGVFDVTSGSTTKTYVQIAGTSESFTKNGSSYTADKANGATLTQLSNGDLLYTASDGTTIEFTNVTSADTASYCPGSDAPTCRVPITITHPDGIKFSLTWDLATQCVQKIGPDCGSEWDYQRLHSVTSSAGYTLSITYWSNLPGTGQAPSYAWYRRTSVAFNNTANPPATAPTITYTYPGTIDVTDPAGRTWAFTTDTNGRLTGIQRPGSTSNNISYAYGADGTVSSATKDGVTNSYSRSVVGSTATETVTDALSKLTVVTSDLNAGRPTSAKDPLGHTTSYTYDTNARLTQVTAPEGNYVQYAYDARGNVTTTTNVAKSGLGLANIVASASFDATCANVVKCNEPNSTTDARNNTTNYTYDPTHGGILTITQPAPSTGAVQPQTRYSYSQVTSASGNPVYMLTGISACQTSASCTGSSDETKTTAAYNSNLLPTSVTQGSGDGALSATTAYTYDTHGNVTSIDGPLAGTADTTAYKYDAADQLVGVISANPGNGQPDRAVKYSYDSAGNLWETSLGTVSDQSDTAWSNFSEAYHLYSQIDSSNRIIRQTLWSNGTDYAVWDFVYDALNRPICRVQYMNPASWGPQATSCTPLQTTGPYGADQVTQNIYDAAGELTQVQVGVGTADAANERTLSYTPNGLVTAVIDGENNRTSYFYDGFDRLYQTLYPSSIKGSGSSNSSDYEQLGYDANGNILSRRLRDGNSISYSYDTLNRMTLKTLPSGEVPVSYSYDNLGHTTGITESGYAMSFAYDALGRQTAENQGFGSITRQFDLAGHLTRTTWWDGFYVTYDRLPTGEVSAVRENGATSGVGVLASYTYDKLGNRTGVTFGNGVTQAYTFDAVSRLSQLTNTLSGTANNLTATFAYNPASAIASTTRSNDVYAYTGSKDVNRSYTSTGLNQYSFLTVSPVSYLYGYDAKGNLTSDAYNDYTYWSENWLKTKTGGTSISYDPLGRMVEYDTSVSTRFVYDGPEMAAEVNNPAGAIQHRYIWGDGPDELLVDYVGSGTTSRQFASRDERGSIISLTDSAGNLVGTKPNTYDEYGIPGSANQGRFQYTGQAWMPEIGMYYYKARMYSTTLGRFMQTDPIGYGDGPNWYAYAHNDPVNRVDPSGLCDPDSVGGCVPNTVTAGLDGSIVITALAPWASAGFPVNGSLTQAGVNRTDGWIRKPPPGHPPGRITGIIATEVQQIWKHVQSFFCSAPTAAAGGGVDAYAIAGGSIAGAGSINPRNGQISFSFDLGVGLGLGGGARAIVGKFIGLGSPTKDVLPVVGAGINANATGVAGAIGGTGSYQLIGSDAGDYGAGYTGGAEVSGNVNLSAHVQVNLPSLYNLGCK